MSVCLIVAALIGQVPNIREDLGRLSDVHSVEAVLSPPEADVTLIHLRDWHYVPFDDFVTDLDEDATTKEQRRAFRRFLNSVNGIQRDQRFILRRLNELEIRNVFLEGLTAEDEPIFPLVCRSLWREPHGRFSLNQFENGPNALSIRAAGQVLAEGVQVRVRAADSSQTLEDCNPFDAEGQRREVSAQAKERREDHMVSRMLDVGTSVIVLGGAHDLSDNVKRLAGQKAKLLVVTPKRYESAK